MAFACYKRLLFLLYWSLVITSDNFNDNEMHHLDGNVLRISCGVINYPSISNPIKISIYEDTPNNTLFSIVYKKCTKVEDSGKDKNIHVTHCVHQGENKLVDVRLGNYNPTGNKHFGCNYVSMVGEDQSSNTVRLDTVDSRENSSPVASSKSESPAAPEGRPEVKEGTPTSSSSTERDGKSVVVHAETHVRYDIWSLVLGALNSVVLLIIMCMFCWKINCNCPCSCGKAAQEQSKTSKDKKHDDLKHIKDIEEYTTINKAKRRDNSQECIEANELLSSPDKASEMSVKIKVPNKSPEIINSKAEYQDDISYTQV